VQHEREARFQFVRVWAGSVRIGDSLAVVGEPEPLQVTGIASLLALDRRPLPQAEAGDVVVIDTTRPVRSGDTLVSPGSDERLAPMEFPEPNLAVTLEPATETDRDAVVATIQRLGSEDPTLLVEEDPETGAIVVAGLGELHLEVFADRVAEEAGRRVRRGRPRIRSRSSIVHHCAAEAECRAASPGRIVWVAAAVELLPTGPDRHAVVRADPELHGPAAAAAVAALREAAAAGVSHAAPLFGAEIRLVRLAGDLKAPEALGLAAEAATIALRKAVGAADPFELEPWTRVEIVAPREVLSGILADLQSRGGDVEQVDQTELGAQVRCLLPLARAIGLPTQLRSLSRGLAEMVMLPAGYRRVPGPEGREGPEKDAGDLDRGHGAR
jgi:elongation factor G